MTSAKKAAPSFKGESPRFFGGGGESPKDRREEEKPKQLERTPNSDRLETENAELRQKVADLEARQTTKAKKTSAVDTGIETLRRKVAQAQELLTEEASLKKQLRALEKKLGRKIK